MNATTLSGKVIPEKGCSKVHRCIDTGLGTTEILVLNKRVYFEAIGLLNAFENIIRISGKGDKVFRDPIAFGKPSFFACAKRASQCYLGPSLSELQVLRLRHLALEVRYPVLIDSSDGTYEKDLSKLDKEVREIAAVLHKCHSLQTFRLILQTKDVHLISSPFDGKEAWRPINVWLPS
jgi:hypothetical protein